MTALDAALLLPFTLAIGIWVAWSDMKSMKIPNKAVLALGAVWMVVGLVVMPFDLWLWGLGFGAIALALGFLASVFGLMGAGDAKFVAAMAPFFVQADVRFVLVLSSACLLGAFAAHRIGRKLPAIRAQSADWASWTHPDFPMGLALAGILNIHMAFVATAQTVA